MIAGFYPEEDKMCQKADLWNVKKKKKMSYECFTFTCDLLNIWKYPYRLYLRVCDIITW